jgi:hypothetical protein
MMKQEELKEQRNKKMIRFAGQIIEVKKLFPKTGKSRFIKVSQMEEEVNNVMSQEEAIAKFMPEIESNGTDFEKFTQIKARIARPGEMIETITADGKETMNQAQQGDFVVSNLGGSGEEYILSGDKLTKRYKEVGDGIYQATGECRGVVYSGPETSFQASWGQPMVLKPGDMIVTPLPQKGEVYRIARQEFESTYKPIQKR